MQRDEPGVKQQHGRVASAAGELEQPGSDRCEDTSVVRAVNLNGRTPAAQELRAKRFVDMARALATEGGYEAIQMREIARLAPSSLSTLYSYFASKDELIMAAVRSDLAMLRGDFDRRPPRIRPPAGKVGEVFVRAFHAMVRDPGFNVPVEFVKPVGADYQAALPVESPHAFVAIAAELAWGPGHRCSQGQLRTLHMLTTLWTGCVVEWLNGRVRAVEAERRLRLAAVRLVDAGGR